MSSPTAGALTTTAARRGRPARARPPGRAQQAEPDRRAGEQTTLASHVRAAEGGALDPIEPNSATRRARSCLGPRHAPRHLPLWMQRPMVGVEGCHGGHHRRGAGTTLRDSGVEFVVV
jgi:hypothetical protein